MTMIPPCQSLEWGGKMLLFFFFFRCVSENGGPEVKLSPSISRVGEDS